MKIETHSAVSTNLLRRSVVCTRGAYELQRSVTANQVRQLIEPLERRGMRVDVYFGSYGCWGVAEAASKSPSRRETKPVFG